jgi:hypothetical protein
MTGYGRDRLAGVLLLVEDRLEVGNDDEFASPLDQALDELGRQRMPTPGGSSLARAAW